MSISFKISELKGSLPDGVELVAVSKFHSESSVMEAYSAGQRVFGESRVQELAAKAAVLPSDIEWRMIGHLQRNKVRQIVPFVALIESVDSARLAQEIDVRAGECGRVVDILLQINVTQELNKEGWRFEELMEFVNGGDLLRMANLRVRGVMGMATNSDDESVVRGDFAALRCCFGELKPLFGDAFDILSMGMSGDYELAIEHGATSVRIGSSIFGERY